MINSVSNSLTSTNFAQRDYVIVDGKRYPVQKKQSSNPLVSTFAPVYRDVVVIDGKEYPVEQVSDMFGCDKTKDVVIVNGKQHEVNPSFLNAILSQGIASSNSGTQSQKLNYVA